MPKHKTEPFVPEGPRPIVYDPGDCAPYPVEALGPLENVVRVVEDRTQAPVAIAAQSALGVASLLAQAFANVETLSGHFSPSSLYLLTVARSGERKSAADAYLLDPLLTLQKEQQAQIPQRRLEFEAAHQAWADQREELLGQLNEDPEQRRILPLEPQPPMSPNRIVEEPTYEGLVRMYTLGNPSLALFSDEGGQFLGGHAMNSENRQKTSAALNKLWNGKPITRTRQGDGNFTLYGRRFSAHLMVQPTVFTSFVSDPMVVEIGLVPRFLTVWPRSLMGSRLYREPTLDQAPLAAYAAIVRERFEAEPIMDGGTRALEPLNLALTDHGKAMLIEFYNEVELKLARFEPYYELTGTASKAAEQAVRIAGVLAVYENLEVTRLPNHCVECGIKLARYYLEEARRISEIVPIDQVYSAAINLSNYLKEKRIAEFSQELVLQNGPPASRRASEAKKVMTILEDHGHVERLPVGAFVDGKNRKDAWRSLV